MGDKRLNNTIFLMYMVTCAYCSAHKLTAEQFLELDARCHVLNLVSECPDIFDSMTDAEMVKEVDGYVARFR